MERVRKSTSQKKARRKPGSSSDVEKFFMSALVCYDCVKYVPLYHINRHEHNVKNSNTPNSWTSFLFLQYSFIFLTRNPQPDKSTPIATNNQYPLPGSATCNACGLGNNTHATMEKNPPQVFTLSLPDRDFAKNNLLI